MYGIAIETGSYRQHWNDHKSLQIQQNLCCSKKVMNLMKGQTKDYTSSFSIELEQGCHLISFSKFLACFPDLFGRPHLSQIQKFYTNIYAC